MAKNGLALHMSGASGVLLAVASLATISVPMAAHAQGTIGIQNNQVTISFSGSITQENDYTGGTGIFGPTSLVGQSLSGTVVFDTSDFESPIVSNGGLVNGFYVDAGSSIQFSENIAGQVFSWDGGASGDAAIYLYQYSVTNPTDGRTQITATGFNTAPGAPNNTLGGSVSIVADGQLFSDYSDLSNILNGSSGSIGQTETDFWDGATDNYDYNIFDDLTYTVQVTPVSNPNPVPEPPTVALVLSCFGFIPVVLRFRRRRLAARAEPS